ncbi:MAG TPA: hypothetical protein VMM78_12230 [Thermomicrobiales bacterium]|nr:hypothetical protein [Thermomicrobiales bacterium]
MIERICAAGYDRLRSIRLQVTRYLEAHAAAGLPVMADVRG